MAQVDGMQVLEFAKNNSPESEVIIITAYATQDTALEAMKKGAYDYLIKPFKMDELVLRVKRLLHQKTLGQENKNLKQLSSIPKSLPGIIGKSSKMGTVFSQIEKVAYSKTTVIIRG